MILAALLLATQVVPYHELPRANRETHQACNEALLRVQRYLGKYGSFVTQHEIGESPDGRLTVDQAVVYRLDAENFMRQYLDEIRNARDGNYERGYCETIEEVAIYEFRHEVLYPIWGPSHGFSLINGEWVRTGTADHGPD